MEKYDESSRGNNNNKRKETWMSFSQYGRGAPPSSGPLGDLSWPQRSYSCSFCRREFRSAQALGGHMNVHRRDKARLRESPPLGPPLVNPNPNPNLGSAPIPNLNMPLPSSATGDHYKTIPVASKFPSELSPLIHLSSLSASTSIGEDFKTMETGKSLPRIGELKDLEEEGSQDESQKSRKLVKLDLEIGVFGDHGDDLDLELRLGYT